MANNPHELAHKLAFECIKAKLPELLNSNLSHVEECSKIAKEYNEYLTEFKKCLIQKNYDFY